MVDSAQASHGDGAEFDDESVVELDPAEALEFLSRDDDESADGEPDRPDAAPGHESSDSLEIDAPDVHGYAIEGVIGRGATGVVYRARQLAVDRPVALKVLHAELITNPRAVRRLKREARLAARLAHPSIISAIDMGCVDGLWWYAMELVVGVPLSRRIAERGQLSERECLRLFSPLCDALQHAHEVGVVHRDIKPANILLDQRGRARLVDLGLAMGPGDPSITKTGSTLGTPHYVSPEQARDPSQADIRSDIWSVGATLYHAVCGHPPFHATREGDSGVAEILSRVLYEPVVDPREFAPNLSKGFSLMLRKCLTRDPEQRYQEPWEMVADIELLRERRRLDVSGVKLDAYASRRPAWLGRVGVALALLVAVAATWAATARPWEEEALRDAPVRVLTLRDWPELDAIARGLEAGTLSAAGALAELESPALTELEPDLGVLRNELVVRVKGLLDAGVRAWTEDVTGRVDLALGEREFDQAEALLGERLGERLQAATGFRDIESLPRGRVKLRATTWLDQQRERVAAARLDAVRSAEKELLDAYPSIVGAPLEVLVAEHRWRDALDWLDPKAASEWEQRAGATVRLDGLTRAERAEVFDTIQGRLRSEQSEVRRRVTDALEESRDFLQVERERLLGEIDEGRWMDGDGAAERFAAAVAAKHDSQGLLLQQLPVDDEVRHRAQIEAVRDELERVERGQRVAAAAAALEELDRSIEARTRARDYEPARALIETARGEPWRRSTFAELDLRRREIELLDSVLQRAAAGVARADGNNRELTLPWAPVVGRVESGGGEVLRHGFRFRPDFGRREEMWLVLSRAQAVAYDGPDLAEARELHSDDVLAFAGLLDAQATDPSGDLTAAAFLLAEGRPRDARARIRLEDQPAGDSLPAFLEGRARRLLAVQRAGDEAQGDSARPAGPPRATRPTLEQAFGTPNQARVGNSVRLVWRFADDGQGPEGIPEELPRGEGRDGEWRARDWDLSTLGYHLRATLPERSDFLRVDGGPTLLLARPFNPERKLMLRLELVPGDGRPLEHLVAVSIRGRHTVFAAGTVWFGTGSLRDLYAHIDSGATHDLAGFVHRPCARWNDGEAISIVIELTSERLVQVSQNGTRLQLPKLYDEPRREDSFVRIRSRGPMTLREAELRGERVSGG